MTGNTIAAVVRLAAGGGAFPRDAGADSAGVDSLFWLATGLGAGAFAIVVLLLVGSVLAWRDRPGRRAEYATGETPRARTLTGVFALLVFLVLDVSLAVKDHHVYAAMYGTSPAPGEAVEVQVLAKQFEWLFRHPGADGRFGTGDDLRSGVLVVPDDRPTVLRMRSLDVVHSLFLPNFRTKQDVLPGMVSTMVIRPGPGAAGAYDIACAELCGLGHAKMQGRLEIRTRAGFEEWLAERRKVVEEYGATESEESWEQWDRRSAAEGEEAK